MNPRQRECRSGKYDYEGRYYRLTRVREERQARHPRRYTTNRIFLETLIGYVEASKCITLDQFTKETEA